MLTTGDVPHEVSDEPKIVAFCHIPKTGGTSVTNLLRGTYGAGHCRLIARSDHAVSERDIDLALRLYPRLNSVSGHHLLPFVDLGAHQGRMSWFTVLREPTERFLSHYHHRVRAGRVDSTFAEWCAEHGSRAANLQVRWIAGGRDVDAAKQILVDRFTVVGDQRDLETSLRAFAGRTGDPRFPTSTTRVDNAGSQSTCSASERELAAQYNDLDLELYSWFRETLWPSQVRDAASWSQRPFNGGLAERTRRMVNLGYHGLIYRNIARLAINRRSTEPDATDRRVP